MTKIGSSTLNNENLRLNAKENQKTSSNEDFSDLLKSGLASSLKMAGKTSNALLKPIPGSSLLSASLSEAAKNLESKDIFDPTNNSAFKNGFDFSSDSMETDMLKNNQELLQEQTRISQMTTIFNTKSNLLKAFYDTLKTIGSNIR